MLTFVFVAVIFFGVWLLVASVISRYVRRGFRVYRSISTVYRNPTNSNVGSLVSDLESMKFFQTNRSTYNQLRNLMDAVQASTNVDESLKQRLRYELSRLGVFLRNGKRHTSTPDEAAQRSAGQAGERDTAYQLQFLGQEYKVFNGIYLSAGRQRQEFDHVVIGPTGVFHIDSKNYSGELKFTKDGLEQNGQPVSDPTLQLHRHEFVLQELFRTHHIEVTPLGVICFTNDRASLVGESPDFKTVKLGRLPSVIKGAAASLDPTQISRIASVIEQNATPSDFRTESN